MVAQDEAVTRILQLNKKFDTVMVYPAFGNEVSKATASDSSELLRLYHWLTSYFARKSDIMWCFLQTKCTCAHSSPNHEQKKPNRLKFFKLKKVNGFAVSFALSKSHLFDALTNLCPD